MMVWLLEWYRRFLNNILPPRTENWIDSVLSLSRDDMSKKSELAHQYRAICWSPLDSKKKTWRDWQGYTQYSDSSRTGKIWERRQYRRKWQARCCSAWVRHVACAVLKLVKDLESKRHVLKDGNAGLVLKGRHSVEATPRGKKGTSRLEFSDWGASHHWQSERNRDQVTNTSRALLYLTQFA